MSRFSDHFEATVLAETFSKIFFSGPMGRIVAITFLLFYLAYHAISITFQILWMFMAWSFRLVFQGIAKAFGIALGSDFLTKRTVLWKIRRLAGRYGDRVHLTNAPNGDWRTVSISGDGFRTGPFRLGFLWHARHGIVRFRHSTEEGEWNDLPTENVLAVLSRSHPLPSIRDIPQFYENARRHYL